jgi:alkylation response protein AidB-like acyl-CoA dehydrogenase
MTSKVDVSASSKRKKRSDRSTFRRVAAGPLKVLTAIGASDLTARLGLAEPGQRLIYEGAKAVTRVAKTAAGALASSTKESPVRLEKRPSSALFDLAPTEEQQLLIDTVRQFADEVVRPAAVEAERLMRAPDEVLQRAQELALPTLAVPEALGGAADALSVVTNVLLIEELARGDMGLALAILAPLAVVHALVELGTKDQQAHYLPRFLGDQPYPAAFALLEPRPLFDPVAPRTGAIRTRDGGWELHGVKSLVPLGQTAELFLVAADVRGAGPKLFLVERGTPGLSIEAEPAMGLRAAGLSRLRLEGVRVAEDALVGVGTDGEARASFERIVDRARIGWGAMAVGAGRAVLEYVMTYCNDRRAFGEPISNRQSVAFLIADIGIELEGMRLLVHRAASLAERSEEVSRAATLARVQCAAKGMKIGTDGVGLLGGHGFIKDHPVERWYRDLCAIGVMEGGLLA